MTLLEPPSNPAAYAADLDRCTRDLANYSPRFDFGSVGLSAFSGAAKNAAGGAVAGPLIPALGALGSASDAASAGLDLMGQSRQTVFANCVRELTHRDESALVAEPQ